MTNVFTPDALLELVHRFYPTNLYSSEPGYVESEQFQRLIARRVDVVEEMGPRWSEFVRQVKAELPGCLILDMTYLRHDNCFRCRVYPAGTDRTTRHVTAAVACLSILTPGYIIYTSYRENINGVHTPARTFYNRMPDTEAFESVLESNIHSIFGFTRIPNDVLFTPVPDIQCFNVMLGKAILADCLFTDDRR
jgi:hypothetical protein